MIKGSFIIPDASDGRAAQFHQMQLRCYPAMICEPIELYEKMLRHEYTVKLAIYDADHTMAGYCFAYPFRLGRVDFYDGPDACSNAQHFYLHELTIDPDYQGAGLGQMLYEAVEKQMISAGARVIHANAIDRRLDFWLKMRFDATSASDYLGMISTRVEKII